MNQDAVHAIATALSISLGIPVRPSSGTEIESLPIAREIVKYGSEQAVVVCDDGQRFSFVAYDAVAGRYLLAGPYRLSGDQCASSQVLEQFEEDRLRASLDAAVTGLRLVIEEPQMRSEQSRQMEILSSAIVAISGELQLETVLRRITDLARSLVAAQYAALGVPDSQGRIETFVTAGLSDEEEARIGERPEGRGILGLLLRARQPLRLDDLAAHPAATGFPEYHPAMRSFLGTPIISRSGATIGSLYLTEKRDGDNFTQEDELLIELLARHAAVAIENAGLYQRLKDEEQHVDRILDQLPEAVMLVDRESERVVVMNRNARRLLGQDNALPIPLSDLAERCEFSRVNGEPIAFEETPIMRSVRTGAGVSKAELTVVHSSGESHTLLVNSKPIDLDANSTACVCVFQDISELRDADRVKDDFLSLVSHELRTPLTTIQGGAQMLRENFERLDQEVRDELLLDIFQESERLTALIQNMVQLTHIRAGRIALEPEPVLLRVLVERCVEQFRPLAGAREFRVKVAPGVVAMADADRVDEMLRNVIHNALKYTPDGSPIDIHALDDADQVKLSVRDYGPGIPAHEIDQVFERFERGSKSSSDTSGMGLGLYLVQLLVEAQGGTVELGLPDGGGTEVVFSLPRATADS